MAQRWHSPLGLVGVISSRELRVAGNWTTAATSAPTAAQGSAPQPRPAGQSSRRASEVLQGPGQERGAEIHRHGKGGSRGGQSAVLCELRRAMLLGRGVLQSGVMKENSIQSPSIAVREAKASQALRRSLKPYNKNIGQEARLWCAFIPSRARGSSDPAGGGAVPPPAAAGRARSRRWARTVPPIPAGPEGPGACSPTGSARSQ